MKFTKNIINVTKVLNASVVRHKYSTTKNGINSLKKVSMSLSQAQKVKGGTVIADMEGL